MGHDSKGMGMSEQQQRLAQEREEIATRVAQFKATQQKFEREREEYFVTTLENALQGSGRRTYWA
jgi:chorismate mutase